MRVSSDLPYSVRDVPALRRPSQTPEVQQFERQVSADQEFPLNIAVGYDWFLQPGSTSGFRRTVRAVSIAFTLFLAGFLLFRGHNSQTFPLALVFVLAILVIVVFALFTVSFTRSGE
ncbi:MAG: hypothetical protein WCD47_20480 [Candidatus Sulfotelmatobacter sp.]